MFNIQFKTFLLVVAFIALGVLSIGGLYTARLADKINWCGEKGGVMLKTVGGRRCIDAKVLTNERTY
jgi:hypothetical protein